MSKLSFLLSIAYENAYDLKIKKQYSEPKLFDAGGDLNARWYVYFSFRNPESDKLERQTPIYEGLHQHKNLRDRRAAGRILVEAVSNILRAGLYNPFSDKSEFSLEEARKLTITEAVDFVLALKAKKGGGGYADFKSRVQRFAKWLSENGFQNRFITSVKSITVKNYLNHVMMDSSARNRNNTRTAISMFYKVLADNEIVPENFIEKINIESSSPKRNRSLTNEQETKIFELLSTSETGRRVALYLKFVGWGMLRCTEANRLCIKDINVTERIVTLRTKNKPVKIKRIPDALISELPNLEKFDESAFLFGYYGYGEHWDANETSRRTQYGHWIKELVKSPLKLDENYGAYSFRHTYVARIFRNLLKTNSHYHAESECMLITGHTSIKAFRMYLRDIDAELPDDYSHLLK